MLHGRDYESCVIPLAMVERKLGTGTGWVRSTLSSLRDLAECLLSDGSTCSSETESALTRGWALDAGLIAQAHEVLACFASVRPSRVVRISIKRNIMTLDGVKEVSGPPTVRKGRIPRRNGPWV